MRKRTRYLLALAAFAALAATFDGFGIAAVYKAGFDGVQRFLLATICVIVGTVTAFALTAPLIRRITRRRNLGTSQ
jgi:hypothetical protein